MGRPSCRDERRKQILGAFARVMATHGYAGATIVAVAEEAGLAPGLLHHHFANKKEMLHALLDSLLEIFRRRRKGSTDLDDYLEAALGLEQGADTLAAKCWVSVLAEALRDPALFDTMKRRLDAEVTAIEALGGIGSRDASALLAFVLGALVLGAFAPRRTSGFAAPSAKALRRALSARA